MEFERDDGMWRSREKQQAAESFSRSRPTGGGWWPLAERTDLFMFGIKAQGMVRCVRLSLVCNSLCSMNYTFKSLLIRKNESVL
jgi:hypothetical protein